MSQNPIQLNVEKDDILQPLGKLRALEAEILGDLDA
jgi:hypothetical protein